MQRLDLTFDVINELKRENKYDEERAQSVSDNLILETFKEALRSNQFTVALKVRYHHDLVLDEFLAQVNTALIESIQSDPFFMEVKLNMVEQNVPRMNYN